MNCAVGCGKERATNSPFCAAHLETFQASPESRRIRAISSTEPDFDRAERRYDAAWADFARRIEAEERNSK
jgi:hypothetical protein